MTGNRHSEEIYIHQKYCSGCGWKILISLPFGVKGTMELYSRNSSKSNDGLWLKKEKDLDNCRAWTWGHPEYGDRAPWQSGDIIQLSAVLLPCLSLVLYSASILNWIFYSYFKNKHVNVHQTAEIYSLSLSCHIVLYAYVTIYKNYF